MSSINCPQSPDLGKGMGSSITLGVGILDLVTIVTLSKLKYKIQLKDPIEKQVVHET